MTAIREIIDLMGLYDPSSYGLAERAKLEVAALIGHINELEEKVERLEFQLASELSKECPDPDV